jgi:hypothetical protein
MTETKTMKKTRKQLSGRSVAGRTTVRVPLNLRDRVIKWAELQDDAPNISEAVRRLVELALGTQAGSRSGISKYVWLECECDDRSFSKVSKRFDRQYEKMSRPGKMMLLSFRRADETVAYVRIAEGLRVSYPKFNPIDAKAIPAHAQYVAGARSRK